MTLSKAFLTHEPYLLYYRIVACFKSLACTSRPCKARVLTLMHTTKPTPHILVILISNVTNLVCTVEYPQE